VDYGAELELPDGFDVAGECDQAYHIVLYRNIDNWAFLVSVDI
jgi:hypothetical protein